jgi:hypothetical protein
MVINNFNIVSIIILPRKTQAPSLGSVASQCLKTIERWNAKIIKPRLIAPIFAVPSKPNSPEIL